MITFPSFFFVRHDYFCGGCFFLLLNRSFTRRLLAPGFWGVDSPRLRLRRGPPKPKQLLIPAHGRIFLFAFYFFCLCSCMVTLWCFLGTFNRMPGGGKRLGSVARALAKQPMLQASRVWHAYFLLFFFTSLNPFCTTCNCVQPEASAGSSLATGVVGPAEVPSETGSK